MPWGTRWYLQAAYLGPLIGGNLLAALALVVAVSSRELARGRRAQIGSFSISLLLTSGLWVFWQSIGQPALDYNYFAYPLVFPLVGALAAFYAAWGPRVLGAGAKTLLLLVVPLSFVLLLAATGLLPPGFGTPGYGSRILFGAIGLTVSGAILILTRWRPAVGASLFALALGATNLGVAVGDGSVHLLGINQCPDARHAFQLVLAARRHVLASEVPLDRVYVWFDQDEQTPGDPLCRGVSSVYVQGFATALISTGFQYVEHFWEARVPREVGAARIRDIGQRRGRVIFMTNDVRRVGVLVDRFAQEGVRLSEVRHSVIRADRLRVGLVEMNADMAPPRGEGGRR